MRFKWLQGIGRSLACLFRLEGVTMSLLSLACLVILASAAAWAFEKPDDPAQVGVERFRPSQGSGLFMARLPGTRSLPPRWNQPVRVWVGGKRMADALSVRDLTAMSVPASCLKGGTVIYVNAALLALAGKHGGKVTVAYDAPRRLQVVVSLAAAVVLLLTFTSVLRGVRQPSGLADASMVGRLAALDSLRGVAAFIVLLSHLPLVFLDINWVQTSFVDGVRVPAPAAAEWIKYTPLSLLVNGPLMVHVFWVLSGLVLALPHLRKFSPERLGFAVAKRYFRLMPLAAFSTLASYVLLVTGAATWGYEYGVVTGMPQGGLMGVSWAERGLSGAWVSALILRNDYNIPLWTVALELVGSLALFAIIAVSQGLQRRQLVWWALLGIFAFITRQYYMADFMAGLLLADRMVRAAEQGGNAFSNRLSGLVLLGSVFLGTISPGWLTLLVGEVSKHYETLLMIATSTGLVSLAAFSPAVRRRLSVAPLIWLGERSFALYVIHALVMQGLGQGAVVLAIQAGLNVPGAVVGGMVLSTVATLWLSSWVMRHVDLPSMVLANKVGGWLMGIAVSSERPVEKIRGNEVVVRASSVG